MLVNRNDLLKALTMLKPLLAKIDLIPVLKHFCFDGQYIIATNGWMAGRVEFDFGTGFSVNGENLLKFLSQCSVKELDMEIIEGTVKIKVGKATAKFPIGSVENFPRPKFSCGDNNVGFSIPENFKKVLRYCETTISGQETYHQLNCLQVQQEDVFSTNAHYMSWAKLTPPIAFTKPVDFASQLFLSEEACSFVLNMGELEDQMRIDSAQSLYVNGKSGLELVIKMPEIKDFPPCADKFYKHIPEVICSIPEGINEIIGKASLFAGNALNKFIVLTIEGNELEISANSEALGSFKDHITFTLMKGEPKGKVTFNVNPDDFAIAIKSGNKFGFINNDPKVLWFEDETTLFHQLLSAKRG